VELKSEDLKDVGPPARAFSDVKPDDWYYKELQSAVNAGLVNGFEDGTFKPDDPATREQVAAMVSRALRAKGKAGVGGALTATQAEALLSAFADRTAVSAWAVSDLALAVNEGMVRGQTANTVAPQSDATRAEAATVIARFWKK
jgi:hypothetical protein